MWIGNRRVDMSFEMEALMIPFQDVGRTDGLYDRKIRRNGSQNPEPI